MSSILAAFDPRDERCITPKCKDCGGAYIILAAVAIVILIYFLYLKTRYWNTETIIQNDFMNVKLFDAPLENCCSMWPVSHFILFMILGFIFPSCAVPIISIGILWEIFEVLMSYAGTIKRQATRVTPSNVEYSTNWWAGSFKDIIMNCLGFFVGWLMAKLFRGKKA